MEIVDGRLVDKLIPAMVLSADTAAVPASRYFEQFS
jgi:hypothetical protein